MVTEVIIPKMTQYGLWTAGCSSHMTREKRCLSAWTRFKSKEVRLGDDQQLSIEGLCIVTLRVGEGEVRLLDEVQYVPALAHNLLSVGQLTKKGYDVNFKRNRCFITDEATRAHIISVMRTGNFSQDSQI